MEINGWLNVYKPAGITSNNVVSKLKHILHPHKIGHGGTLDPFASGVLPICLNKATKTVEYVMDHKKTYVFDLSFGQQTDTGDKDGRIIAESNTIPDQNTILEALPYFIGTIQQTPPKYSALKINGKRACDLMRQGFNPDMKPRSIVIESINYNGFINNNTARFTVICGRGCYIRSLAEDLALKLNTLGFVTKLERTKLGIFTVEDAISLEDFHEIDVAEKIYSLEQILQLEAVELNEVEFNKVKNGIHIYKSKANGIYQTRYNQKVVCLAKIQEGILFVVKMLI